MHCQRPLELPRAMTPVPRPSKLNVSGGLSPEVLPPSALTLAPGARFGGRFTILRLVAHGGMGSVYLASDANTGEQVCLKLIRPELVATKLALERFLHEGKVARRLSHPNIARVFDIDQHDGVWFISMEFAPGENLRAWMQKFAGRKARIGLDNALWVFRKLLHALHHLHGHQVIHRDVKPENIVLGVGPDGRHTLKLVDFGLARGLREDAIHPTLSGAVVGTTGYMAPEQRAGGEVDARADLYSAAVILYELLSGVSPEGLWEPITEVRPGLPLGLDGFLKQALSKSPEKRHSSAKEMLDALELALVSPGFESVPSEAEVAVGPPLRQQDGSAPTPSSLAVKMLGVPWLKHRVTWLLLAAISLAAFTGLVWTVARSASRKAANELSLAEARAAVEAAAAATDYAEAVQKYTVARDRYREVLTREPGHPETLAALTRIDSSLEKCEEARLLSNKGEDLRSKGDLASAIEAFDQALLLMPRLAVALMNRGVAHSQSGLKDAALADYDQALNVRPEYPRALANRGGLRIDLGDLRGALADLDAAIQLDPTLAQAYTNRGLAKTKNGQPLDALSDFEFALRYDPRSCTALHNRSMAYEALGFMDRALADCDEALRLSPTHSRILHHRASLRKADGDFAGAMADFDSAILSDPTYAAAYADRGDLHKRLGKLKLAESDYREALGCAPRDWKYRSGVERSLAAVREQLREEE